MPTFVNTITYSVEVEALQLQVLYLLAGVLYLDSYEVETLDFYLYQNSHVFLTHPTTLAAHKDVEGLDMKRERGAPWILHYLLMMQGGAHFPWMAVTIIPTIIKILERRWPFHP